MQVRAVPPCGSARPGARARAGVEVGVDVVLMVVVLAHEVAAARGGDPRGRCGSDGWEYEEGMPVWMTRVPEDIWWKVLEMTGRW